MKKFFFDCGTRDLHASLGVLFLRISFGLMMLIGHGIPKIQNYNILLGKFKAPDLLPFNMMSDQVSLIAIIFAETVATVLVIFGIATRPAAFIVGFGMVVAAFGTHGADPWFAPPGVAASKELVILYLIPAVTILLNGAGLYSVDGLVPTDKKRRRW